VLSLRNNYTDQVTYFEHTSRGSLPRFGSRSSTCRPIDPALVE
jgi:hypothetical protein